MHASQINWIHFGLDFFLYLANISFSRLGKVWLWWMKVFLYVKNPSSSLQVFCYCPQPLKFRLHWPTSASLILEKSSFDGWTSNSSKMRVQACKSFAIAHNLSPSSLPGISNGSYCRACPQFFASASPVLQVASLWLYQCPLILQNRMGDEQYLRWSCSEDLPVSQWRRSHDA